MTEETQQNPPFEVQAFCSLPAENAQGFVTLLSEMLRFGVLPNVKDLTALWIVPKGKISEFTDAIIRSYDPEGRRVVSSGIDTSGVAIPMEKNGELFVYVLIDEAQVLQVTQDNFRIFDVISTLAEELTHVRLNGADWQRRGYVQHTKGLFGCKANFYAFCATMRDEYIVARWKIAFLNEAYSYIDEFGERGGFQLGYGQPIASLVSQAYVKLKATILRVVTRQLEPGDGLQLVLDVLNRNIFDPLSRDAGFQAASPTFVNPLSDAQESPFYPRVEAYWNVIRIQLDRCFDTDLKESELALDEMVSTVMAFLSSIGIEVNELDDGNCWVHFYEGLL